ncbi:hypothetical protein E1L19_01180 [Salmonella enterica subsp. enterica]|uniref:hypothetical protein n=1 Tax=Citrobacter sedlakii TaxID=67826 RepID=UPI00126ECD7D|nr:hypothetical protein [Citrobacter sedlakii]ECC3814921.1 hypothetical protein [Salmonella enterica subsp. enterica]ECC8734479.1 hypothetical protein [Salmonella bongori]EDA0852627.1 hypothetical protein [Salmonella enterica]ECI7824618.1 hypothetical protein [Salmonella enterica subsp. enterica]EDH1764993.1 hypothetical protein [Salmonella enterica]
MTDIIHFKPDGREPFQFTVTVGEYELFARVPFNLYANRYYLELKDSSGDVVVYCPLIASPENYDINLALPCVPGKLIFRESTSQFEVS